MHAWGKVLKELRGVVADVTGTVVHDQRDAISPTVGMKQSSHRRTKMLAIILVQAFGPHMSVVDRQSGQQIDRAMAMVFKFLTLNLARPQRLFGRGAFENLKVGLLVHRQEHLALLPQALDSLVIPEDFEGPLHGFLLPARGLPPPKAMELQIG